MELNDTLGSFLDEKHIDIESLPIETVHELFSVINGQMAHLYRFVLMYNEYMNNRHPYTPEEALTTLEAHLLTDICDFPNSTVTSLAGSWHRSVSATSQTVRKLIQKELITRENSTENAKVFYLIPTPKGMQVSEAHKRYDTLDTIKTLKTLRHSLTDAEIAAFFKTIKAYESLLE